VKCFDLVSSQAWLEPVKGGFEIQATKLFYELNDRKVLGIYENISGNDGHIGRIIEKYPEYLPLNLVQPNALDDEFADIPF
jgi:hypothetical protein